jgi:hypothetical protein
MPTSTRPKRAAAVALAAGILLLGAPALPAQASPGAAAKTLAGLKYTWQLKTPAQQVRECAVFTRNRTLAINSAVTAITTLPSTAGVLTAAETRNVATRYLRWACSGPGNTPR